MEYLHYFVPEHVDSLPRLKARYKIGISNEERRVLWKELLVMSKDDNEVHIDTENLQLREDVVQDVQTSKFINQCTNDTPEEVARKLSILITHYLQQNPTVNYHPRFIHAAFPFLAVGLDLEDAYRCLNCFLKIFLPKFFTEDKKVLQSKADLLRLLILYHDPSLCTYMDQRGVSPISYVHDWWSVLFFETCTDLTTVLTLWDNIFLAWDPYLYMFISLVLILRTRDQIMKGSADEIPLLVSTTQIGDFTEVSRLIQHALSLSETTPHAFRCQLCAVTHQEPLFFEFLHDHLKKALCLSVGVQDVVATKKPTENNNQDLLFTPPSSPKMGPLTRTYTPPQISTPPPQLRNSAHRTHTRTPSSADDYPKFAQEIYDCRSMREYNSGRLPSSVHLDPEKLLNRLGVAHYSSQHIALLPRASQPGEEQGLIVRLLQFGIPYLSCISSGYEACHAMYKEGRIYLENHNETTCLICTGQPPPITSPPGDNMVSSNHLDEMDFATTQPSHQTTQATHTTQTTDNHQEGSNLKLSGIFSSGKFTKMMKDTQASFVSGSKKLGDKIKAISKNDKERDEDEYNNEITQNAWIANDVAEPAPDPSSLHALQDWKKHFSVYECKQVKKRPGVGCTTHLGITSMEVIELDGSVSNDYIVIRKRYELAHLYQITYKKSDPKTLFFKYKLPAPLDPIVSPDSTPAVNLLDTPNDFQDITLSPPAPVTPVPPSPTTRLKIKTFSVPNSQELIDTVHKRVASL